MTEQARHETASGSLMRIDAVDGPAKRMTAPELDARAEALVDLWMASRRGAASPRRGRRVLWLAAAVVAVTGSAAAMWSGRWIASAPASRAPARAIAARPEPAPVPVPAPQSIVRDPAALRPAAPAAPARDQTQATQDLLRRANQLRGSGRYRAAERLYLRVLHSAPNGASAQIAAVAAASLRLEHLHDARGALALYLRARAAGAHAPLALETEEGIARAYARLGEREHERRTLERIASGSAEGPVVDRARARLQALDPHE